MEIYKDGSDLIMRGNVEAVLIATPHYQHPTLSVQALKKGLHVMSEKPVGVYTKAIHDVIKAADDSGKVFAVMFNQRTNGIYRKMHEIVHSGTLGEIRRVNWIITDWYRTQSYYDSGSWRATWDGEGGGVLLNQCPHQLDLLQWICGMPVKVRSFMQEGKWHNIEVEDEVTTYMQFENGATGVFITSTGDAPGTNRFEVTMDGGKLVCENGTLTLYKLAQRLSEHLQTCKEGFAKPDCEKIEIETDGENQQHPGVLNAFAGKILRGADLVADGREGIRGLQLSNAMHLSHWQNRTVDIPFDEEVFLGELNKRRATSGLKEETGITFDTDGSYGDR